MGCLQQEGVGLHSHIHSLSNGYVHGEKTEKQMEILNRLIMAGCGPVIQIVGPQGTGRDAFVECLLGAISRQVVRVCATDLHRDDFDIDRLMRRTCLVKFSEQVRVVQGEVVSMTHDKIVLKTQDMESAFEIGVRMRAEIECRRVQVGDVIKIYREAGLIVRLGLSAAYGAQDGIYGLAPLPEGECCQVEEKETLLTLDELDSINTSGDLNKRLLTLLETPKDVREEVNTKVQEWASTGKATVEKGVLLVEQADILSEKALKKILSSRRASYKPTVIFLTSTPVVSLQTETMSIFLEKRNNEIARKVILLRASYYGIELPVDITEFYLGLAMSGGLSYALSIMQAAAGANAQTLEQVQQVCSLFVMPKRINCLE